MKRLTLLFLLMSLLALPSCKNSDNDRPKSFEISLNWDWKFCLGEMDSPFWGDECPKEGWKRVNIPHDWSIQMGYTQENTAGSNGFLPGGVGWYQKEIQLPASAKEGQAIAVRFEGVYNNSTTWINGHELGFFPNGYLDFEYDLTPYINWKGKNVITVRVDRRAYADARWYVGAGIYRPVHLIVRDDVYTPTHGQRITTPEVTAERATVQIETDFTNRSASEQTVLVEYQISHDSKIIETIKSSITLAAGETLSDSQSVTIKDPALWSVSNGQLYDLYTFISREGSYEYLERKYESFGLRNLEFTPDRGFLLNGKMVKIKGVNLHHDLGSLGVALHNNELFTRLKSLQDMGVNAIRTAHNPHSESLLDMCDRMGILVMNEFTDEWLVMKNKWITQRSKSNIPDSLESGYPTYFQEFAERDLKNFMRRDLNHPSVIMWSIGNEIEWTYPYYFASSLDRKGYKGLVFTGEPEKNRELTKKRFAELSKGNDELSQTAHKLSKWVKEIDTTRPIISGVVIPSVSRISGYVDALDIVGYNYKDSYYEIDHEMYPEKMILGSENVGQYFEWAAVADKDYIPGIFLWTGVDYLGENGPWPAKGGTYSLFDFACFKTPRGHFFETLWRDQPKTHLVTTPASMSEFKRQSDGTFEVVHRKDPLRRWLWYETFDKWSYKAGEEIVAQVYTNAPQVELLLNGRSLGTKKRSDFAAENIILWQLPYEEGELIAVGQDLAGKELSRHSLRTAEALSTLAVTAPKHKVAPNSTARFTVELLDKNGTRIVDRPTNVTITLPKGIKVVGVDNGSDRFVGDHQANTIETHNGRALFIIQAKRGVKGKQSIKFATDNGIATSTTIDLR